MQLKSLLTTLLILLVSSLVFAQGKKMGDVDKNTLSATAYPIDSSAEAIVLFDIAKTSIEPVGVGDELQLVTERHLRIKILKKEGYDYANIEIPYYIASASDKEDVTNIKGFTHVLENGQIQSYKLENTSIFNEKVSENKGVKKIAMPNVKEGAVIEVSYRFVSKYLFTIDDWYFQGRIPKLWSEITFKCPTFYIFSFPQQGYHKGIAIDKSIEITNYGYSNNVYKWVASNVPALKKEDYTISAAAYISKMKFQLESIAYPNRPVENFLKSWEDIAKLLLESESFGKLVKDNGYVKNIADSLLLLTNSADNDAKINTLMNYLKKNIAWDENNNIYTSKSFRGLLNEGKSNSAGINLSLVAMLRAAKIDAYPILVCTKDHGFASRYIVSQSTFNTVLAAIKVSDGYLILDATRTYLPNNFIPDECLNGEGLIIKDVGAVEWFAINTKKGATTTISSTLQPDAEGIMKGKIEIAYKDYAAIGNRSQIHEDTKETFLKEIIEGSNYEIQNSEFKKLEEVSPDLQLTLEVVSQESLLLGNMMYITPFTFKKFEENPFKQETRILPVDFPYNIQESNLVTIAIPEGFVVETLPSNLSIATPDKSFTYSYVVGVMDKNIQVRSKITINKTFFSPEEYKSLREIMAQAINKQNEQIVLKKTP
ncbi:MAG: DUF3857 domain-containing protein [Cytophagales bacterium]|nr:MAG: DUF3857 domain-containing protein [Cytophagales bacterium]